MTTTNFNKYSYSYPICFIFSPDRYSDYSVEEISLANAKIGKRKRSLRWPWTVSYSMILFRSRVFEWSIEHKTYYIGRSPHSCQITWRSQKKGPSSCLINNCRGLVNKLVKYLWSKFFKS